LHSFHIAKAGKERKIGFDPCAVSWLVKEPHKRELRTEFLLVGGSNRECQIYSREGIKLGVVCTQDAWIWCCCAKPDGSAMVMLNIVEQFVLILMYYIQAIGTTNGTISIYDVKFGIVHGIHKDRYAYRDNMTDVIVHHLISDQKSIIEQRMK
jgi:intraflagellar transport protein 122